MHHAAGTFASDTVHSSRHFTIVFKNMRGY